MHSVAEATYIIPVCGMCHIAPAIQIFEVATEGSDSVHVFAVILAYIGYYSILVLAIIYGLPPFMISRNAEQIPKPSVIYV